METVESELIPLPRTRDGIATNYAPASVTQVVLLVPKNSEALAATIVTEAAPSIVLPVCGYTVKVSAPSLRTTIIAPASAAGSLTPVPEATVDARVIAALTSSASVALEPAAVTEADTSPQIAVVAPPD
jgi:hypothetical protein